MAVDKKSDYYTTSEQYQDLDGNLKQFTFIDHDPKTTIASVPSYPGAVEQWNSDKNRLVERVIKLPPSLASSPIGIHIPLIIRNVEEEKLQWNEEAIRILVEVNYWELYRLALDIEDRMNS